MTDLAPAHIVTRRHWIFDLDGTLTVAVHDFDAIRAELGLPPGGPILEALAELPAAQAARLRRRLDEIELELARGAQAHPQAEALLQHLHERGCALGIATRNSLANTRETLQACALQRYFDQDCIMHRDSGPPKPRPDALLALMRLWQAAREDVVMVGDFLFDLLAGRAAGVATVYVDPAERFPWSAYADLSIPGLGHLLPRG